jgi:hypothetical protein
MHNPLADFTLMFNLTLQHGALPYGGAAEADAKRALEQQLVAAGVTRDELQLVELECIDSEPADGRHNCPDRRYWFSVTYTADVSRAVARKIALIYLHAEEALAAT